MRDVLLPMVLALGTAGWSSSDWSLSSLQVDEFIAQIRRDRKACGPVAVWYCMNRFGYETQLDDVLDSAVPELDDEGISLHGIINLCNSFRLPVRAVRSTGHNLAAVPQPAILVLHRGHCVVYEGLNADSGTVTVFDPTSHETEQIRVAEFAASWTGEAIVFGDRVLSLAGFLATLWVGALSTFVSVSWIPTLFRWREKIMAGRRVALDSVHAERGPEPE